MNEKPRRFQNQYLCGNYCKKTQENGRFRSDIKEENPLRRLGAHGIYDTEFDRRLKLDKVTLMLLCSNNDDMAWIEMRYDRSTKEAYFFVTELYYSEWWNDEIMGATNITSVELQNLANINGVHKFDGLTEQNWLDYFEFINDKPVLRDKDSGK